MSKFLSSNYKTSNSKKEKSDKESSSTNWVLKPSAWFIIVIKQWNGNLISTTNDSKEPPISVEDLDG